MNKEIIVIIILILSGSEIFFNVFTKIFKWITGKFNKEYSFSEKFIGIYKLIFVAIFMASVVFFIVLGVKALAALLDISLDQSIFDIFR